MKSILVYAYVLMATYVSYGQEPSNLWEEQADRSTYELSNEGLQEVALLQKYEKVDLNYVGPEELANLQILSDLQVRSFCEHRQKYGKLVSIYELKCIPDFDDEVIDRLMPWVYVPDLGIYNAGLGFMKEALIAENHYLMGRVASTLEKPNGYSTEANPSARYLGNPYQYYIRYHLSHREHISMGFTLEKDPGEAFVWNHSQRTYGFDHIVGHVQVYNRGALKRLILGNFTLATGQGLVFANGMYIAKSAESVLFVKRNHIGLVPFKSLLESGYFQGIGATLSQRNTEVTLYASAKRTDTQLHQDTSTLNEEYANTIYNTGFHRTNKEYSTKNKVLQCDAGYNVRWINKTLTLGHSTSYTSFLNPQTYGAVALQPKPTLYNVNAFKGSYNWVSSMDFSYTYRNFNVFGEYARQAKGQGYVLGLQLSLGRRLDVALLYRDYNSLFNSFYANGFAEYFNNNDERGCYTGIKFSPHKRWVFTAYYDLFSSRQLKYLQYAPGQGSEYLMSCSYKPHKKTSLYVQLRHEQKNKNIPAAEHNIYAVGITYRYVAAMSLKYEVERNISLQTKIYTSSHTQLRNFSGVVLAQDILYKRRKLSLALRCALFDIEDYSSRIYLYERDVLYSFSFPAYQGSGVRYYAILQYNLSKHLKIWFKWSQTQYHDRGTIGVAGELIRGNTANDFKIQVQWLLGK